MKCAGSAACRKSQGNFMSLVLRNPHSVLAALQTRPEDVFEIRLAPGSPSPKWSEVAELARQHEIPIRTNLAVEKRPAGAAKSERVGAAVALVRERADGLVDELFAGDPAELQGLWLALEQLQDPHNVGAIFRTAAFFGVNGIVLTRDRSAPLSATVYDVASGGLEYVPFAIVPSLSRAITLAREAGVAVIGTSERAERNIDDVPVDRPRLLIFGNEEHGLRRVTTESCDELVSLPPLGPIQSLNVSVAAGVCMSKLAKSF
jgi:23S rRNA (guanosine2251-2'-O)-methyltransferase